MKTNLHLIEIDETRYWDADFLKEVKVGKVTSVFLFDKHQTTNLCELQPSYWLKWLYSIGYEAEGQQMDCNDEERFDDAVYDWTEDNSNYIHCSSIGKSKKVFKKLDFQRKDPEAYRDKFDEVADELICNRVI